MTGLLQRSEQVTLDLLALGPVSGDEPGFSSSVSFTIDNG
jgi:hypothetical protein